MKNTRFTEPTNIEVILNSHQNDYICYNEAIKTGLQWISYFKKYEPYMLEWNGILKPTNADYYDFDLEEL